jgi:hypothetical protein
MNIESTREVSLVLVRDRLLHIWQRSGRAWFLPEWNQARLFCSLVHSFCAAQSGADYLKKQSNTNS